MFVNLRQMAQKFNLVLVYLILNTNNTLFLRRQLLLELLGLTLLISIRTDDLLLMIEVV